MERGPVSRLPRAIRTTALALAVDAVTAEVVTAMRGAGIRPVLLKGPSIGAWLYGDGAVRPYGDSDLLVSPESYKRAGNVLSALGFRSLGYLSQQHLDSDAWRRSDHAFVDLHRSLVGAGALPEIVWEELATDTQIQRVGGIDVEVLGIPQRALHVALHAAQHGVDDESPLEDLRRAVRTVDEGVWREAAEIARRIDALPAFATGLRLEPDGALLGERLQLPADRRALVVLRSGPQVPVAITLERLASEGSFRARARLLLAALFPSPSYMRKWAAGGRVGGWSNAARRGPIGLALAYMWRPIWILLRLPRAIAAVRRARRAQASPRV